MVTDFFGELEWRGMVQDFVPGIHDFLKTGSITGYAGFDPTAASLGIGNMVPIMMLVHLQRAGHKPIALVGGATAMVGDPSGKAEERKLLSVEQIHHNVEKLKAQLSRFLDFEIGDNKAMLLNNHDWIGRFSFLEFLRDVGKHITVNYMLSKDSVKSRMDSGISFTEFSYQLMQGYDFYHLNKEHDCRLQVGGSDQWGNITTGTELIRRMGGSDSFALTCPLITKSDGTKFGKSESGNIWLDGSMTSPYKFYQFWLNGSDEDMEKLGKIFSLREKEDLLAKIEEHKSAPGKRILQNLIAEEMTERLHGKEALQKALSVSRILFGKSGKEELSLLKKEDFEEVFEGVPSGIIPKSVLDAGIGILDALTQAGATASKSEARRLLNEGGIKINKEAAKGIEQSLSASDLLTGNFILVQIGKKKYHLIRTE